MDYPSTHRDIVERCKRGDRNAQFELYQLYSKAMYNVCLRMLKNEADAQDLLQNSFINIYTKLDSFRYQSSIGAWIKRIVINNCINFLKKRKIYFEELQDESLNIKEEQQNSMPVLSVDKVQHAMAHLPEGYRAIFSLYAFEGYDHKEIAQIMDITESTSKSQYSRAKKKLRDLLESRDLEMNYLS